MTTITSSDATSCAVYDATKPGAQVSISIPGIRDSVVVVTGASGNLGQAVAQIFDAAGARTVLADRDDKRLEDVYGPAKSDSRRLRVSGVDLTDAASVDDLVVRMLKHFGQADVLVNTVGGFRGGKPVHSEDVATWDSLLTLNLRTALLTSRALAGHMLTRGRGRIINVISRNALAGVANYAAYSAAKAALFRMTESMAQELKSSGVTANCVIPGTMDTPQNREGLAKAEINRLVPTGDVAGVILFLASDLARSVTGAAVPVYGKT